jgi:hypothetical protein
MSWPLRSFEKEKEQTRKSTETFIYHAGRGNAAAARASVCGWGTGGELEQTIREISVESSTGGDVHLLPSDFDIAAASGACVSAPEPVAEEDLRWLFLGNGSCCVPT